MLSARTSFAAFTDEFVLQTRGVCRERAFRAGFRKHNARTLYDDFVFSARVLEKIKPECKIAVRQIVFVFTPVRCLLCRLAVFFAF